jgi:hypothetical protein
MARIRTVTPGLFDDPDVGALPAAVRWLFVGLFTQADREGRLADEPRRIKIRLCAYDDDTDTDAALDQLAAAGFILRYEVEGKHYIQIRTFTKHQRPHPREPQSVIPAARDHGGPVNDHGQPWKNTSRMEPASTIPQNPEQFRNAVNDHGWPGKNGSSKVDSGSLDTGSLDSRRRGHDRAPASSPSSPSGANARSKRPIFKGKRFVVFDWQLDDLRQMLGRHFETFGLDEWFDRLDRETPADVLIPQRDGGQWLQARTLEEAQRRGLQVADTSSKPDPFTRSLLAPGTSTEELGASLQAWVEKTR